MTEEKLAFFVPAPAHSHARKGSEIKAILKRGCLGLAWAVLMAIPAWPQGAYTDLANKSLEDLMNIQVTSVSKTEQKLSRTASAVFVINQEDIRRSGATSIPDLLRMVPGLDVAQINGSTWAISARGFNAQFADKLLVMIDSRIVYTPNFAGVYWDTLDLPLEDIDRIEVIRGPGGTIWGANAVNGVISIFTKKATDTHGAMLEAGGGNLEQGFGTAQYGGKAGKATDYRIYSKYFDQSPMLGLTGQNGADAFHMLRGGFRTDSTLSSKDTLMVEGDVYTAREAELGFSLPSITSPALVPVSEAFNLSGGFIQSSWTHAYSARSDSTLQISFIPYRRDDPLEPEKRDTLYLDYQDHIAWGHRQDVVWGLGYSYTTDNIGGSLTVYFVPPSKSLEIFNSFLQDEIALVPERLYLTVGAKLEHNDYTGFETMPNIRMTWAASRDHMVWLAVSKALRVPSRNDTNLVVNAGSFPGPGGTPTLVRVAGDPQFTNEKLIAYEVGYRDAIAKRLSVDIAAYYNDYDNLQTTEPSTPFFEATPLPPHLVLPLLKENLLYGETHGIEITANWRATDRWTLSPGYALEELRLHTDSSSSDTTTGPFFEGGTPNNSAQLRSHFDLRTNLAWDASAYFVGRLTNQGTSNNEVIPAYTRLDTGLTWKAREKLSISVFGQNLLKDYHIEFEDKFGSMQSGQIKRSGYAKITWRF
jgi:iron complex outermembrane receptor protein